MYYCTTMKPHALLFSSNAVTFYRNPGVHRIATYLREHDWDVEVCDFAAHWPEEQIKAYVESRVTAHTKFFGFGVFFNYWTDSLNNLTAYLKKKWPLIPTVLGGQSAGLTKATNIDYWVDSYGEIAMLELAKSFVNNSSSGIRFDFNQLGQRKLIKSLHSYPAYTLDSYKVLWQKSDFIQPWEWQTVEFARGCKFSCAYCNYPILGVKGDNSRAAEDFELQLKHNYDNFGVEKYWIADETFNDRVEKIQKFADVVERCERELNFDPYFTGFLRADLIATHPESLEHMARMRVGGHFYGIETFNHQSAKAVGKGMHPDRVKQTLLDTRDYLSRHIFYRGTASLIVGLPYETPETFLDGQQWLVDNWSDQAVTAWALELENWEYDESVKNNMTNLSKISQNLFKYGIRRMEDVEHRPLGGYDKRINYNWREMGYTPGKLVWEHDTMNIHQAQQLTDGIQQLLLNHFKISSWHLNIASYETMQKVPLTANIFKSPHIDWIDRRLAELYIEHKLNS